MRTVAVVGLNGNIGKQMLSTLRSRQQEGYFSTPIRAISRDMSNVNPSDDQVKYFQVRSNFNNNDDEIKMALDGVDVLIDLTPGGVNSKALIDVAVNSGVKLYFPSEFSTSKDNTKDYPNSFKLKRKTSEYARKKGLKTVEVQCGSFADLSLHYPLFSGVVPDQNLYRRVNGGDISYSMTFIKDLCLSICELAVMENIQGIPNEILIQSDSVTCNYLAKLWEKNQNIKLTIEDISAEQIHEEAKSADAKFVNDASEDFMNYINIVLALVADGKVDHSHSKHMEYLNPAESKFKWTRVREMNRNNNN